MTFKQQNSVLSELARELPEVEVELVDGGQPHYAYLISAE